jgi:CHAD domain-containing protein
MGLAPKRILQPVRELRKTVDKMRRNAKPGLIHAFRLNTRRLETIIDVFSLDERNIHQSTLRDLRRCERLAGKVRDFDVFTRFARTVHPKKEEKCTRRLLKYLGPRRSKRAKTLLAEVRRDRLLLHKELQELPARLTQIIADESSRKLASANARTDAIRLVSQLSSWPRLNKQTLHRYRLKIKDLQNILEMSAVPQTEFLADLTHLKNAIGEWHDWEKLVLLAKKSLNHEGRCGLLAELKLVARGKYRFAVNLARELKKKYLLSFSRKMPELTSNPPMPVWRAITDLA